MCWPTFITRIDHGGLRLQTRPSPSSKSPVPCLLSCFYCGVERCADDGLLLQPDSRIARSSSSGLFALKTGACDPVPMRVGSGTACAAGAAGTGVRIGVGTPIAATACACWAAATVTVDRCIDAGAGAGAAGAAAAVCGLLWGAPCAAVVAGAVLLASQPERAIACPMSVCASALLASSVS